MEGLAHLGLQMKHLAATNPILAVAAQGEGPPADAGDEAGLKRHGLKRRFSNT
jgi:hypothetical protein